MGQQPTFNPGHIDKLKRGLQGLLKVDIILYKNFCKFTKIYRVLCDLANSGDLYGSKLGESFHSIPRKNNYFYIRKLLVIDPIYANFYNRERYRYDYLKTTKNIKKSDLLYTKNSLFDLIKDYVVWLERVKRAVSERRVRELNDLELTKYIINLGNRMLIYRAAGCMASIILSKHLKDLLKNEGISIPKDDDIKPLFMILRTKTKNKSLKIFLNKKYAYFEQAAKSRIASTHSNEKPPTKSEIETMLSLIEQLLNKFNMEH